MQWFIAALLMVAFAGCASAKRGYPENSRVAYVCKYNDTRFANLITRFDGNLLGRLKAFSEEYGDFTAQKCPDTSGLSGYTHLLFVSIDSMKLSDYASSGMSIAGSGTKGAETKVSNSDAEVAAQIGTAVFIGVVTGMLTGVAVVPNVGMVKDEQDMQAIRKNSMRYSMYVTLRLRDISAAGYAIDYSGPLTASSYEQIFENNQVAQLLSVFEQSIYNVVPFYKLRNK